MWLQPTPRPLLGPGHRQADLDPPEVDAEHQEKAHLTHALSSLTADRTPRPAVVAYSKVLLAS